MELLDKISSSKRRFEKLETYMWQKSAVDVYFCPMVMGNQQEECCQHAKLGIKWSAWSDSVSNGCSQQVRV